MLPTIQSECPCASLVPVNLIKQELEWPVFQLTCQLPADPCEVSLNLSRASQSCLNMRKHILSSDMFQKVRACDELQRLIARATKQKRLPNSVKDVPFGRQ